MHFEEIPKVFKAVETQIIFFFNKKAEVKFCGFSERF